jgi:phytoene synthase
MLQANHANLRKKADGEARDPKLLSQARQADGAPATPAAAASVSALVGSSEYRALGDDALKDEDNAAWVLGLAPAVRREWLHRLHWIRLADRLAENERFEPEARRFQRFRDGWRQLVRDGHAAPGPYQDVFEEMRAAWLRGGRPVGEVGRRVVEAWEDYLAALAEYHRPDLVVETIAEHDRMMRRLSGRIFQLVPFLDEKDLPAALELGVLDQYFNNLRDLAEDAASGVCYLPTEVLARFGVAREAVLDGTCIGTPAWRALVGYWTGEYLPRLALRAASFGAGGGLHPSLKTMHAWCRRRHERTLRVMQGLDGDYRRFPGVYWPEVRRELAASGADTDA